MITRLFINLMNYPDGLGNALVRAKLHSETIWDRLRLCAAKIVWRTGK